MLSTEAQAYRQEVKDLMDAGQARDAMAMEVKDVRQAAAAGSGDATKYNKATQQMLQKGKDEGYIPEKRTGQ